MRVDKFIWCVRLCKTRTVAADLISKGKVRIDGVPVKSSKKLNIGEVIEVHKNTAVFEYKIIEFTPRRVGAKLVADFIENVTKKEELEKFELYQMNQASYKKNGGKPSKKDRRVLRGLME